MTNDIFYYSNQDKHLARITRDFLEKFCRAVSEEFQSASTRSFLERTFIPKERELYGLFVKALMKFELSDTSQNGSRSIGHIGTEIKVKRILDDTDEYTGRVDMLVSYRRTSFIIEFKVARISLKGNLNIDNPESCKTLRPWMHAVQQIKDIDTNSLSNILDKKVIKLPIVFHLYADSHQSGFQEDWEELVNEKFINIHDSSVENTDIPSIYFSYLSRFTQPIQTNTRASNLERINNFYGFSIISSDVE